MSYCDEVQRDIAAYMDNLLPKETRRAMEQHIRSCTECRKALSEFETVQGLIKGLDEVEPPPGFTFRIMAEIRETEARSRGLLERLFRPLSVKIPIHAIATLLIVVVALYVYKATEPERKLQPLPGVETGSSIETARPQGKEILTGAEPSTVRREGAQWKDRREPPETNAVDRPAKEVEKKPDQALPEDRSVRQREPEAAVRLEGRAPSPIEGTAKGAKVREEQPVLMQSADQGLRTKGKAAPSGADAALVGKDMTAPDLTVEVVDLARATQEVQGIVDSLAGQILRREQAERKEVFVIETGPDRIDELLGRLSALGNQKVWKPSVPTGRKSVVVTIEFLAKP
jgi:hypothetical protein